MSIKSIVHACLQAKTELNAERMLALLADDVIFESMPDAQRLYGNVAMYEAFKEFFTLVERIEFKHDHEAYEGDVAFIESVIHVKFKGNAQEMALPMVTLIQVKDNKIVLFREYYDYQTLAHYLN